MNKNKYEDEQTDGWNKVGGDLQGEHVSRCRRCSRVWICWIARWDRFAVEQNARPDRSGNLASDQTVGGGQECEADQVITFAFAVSRVGLNNSAAAIYPSVFLLETIQLKVVQF